MKNYYKTLNSNVIQIDDSKEVARGGEGKVIQVTNDLVAKIYLPNIEPITKKRFDDLSILNNSFVKPLDLIFDSNGYIIGFLMKSVSGANPIYSFFNKAYCNRMNISDSDKKHILTQLINAVNFAHSKNLILGDLNPFNILIKDNTVNYIDVDSIITKGEIHNGRLLEEIRDYYLGEISQESDYFALAVIMFNFLTYVHPFKGIHRKCDSIKDRMIHKLSVLDKSSDLIVPKCYNEISDKYLLDQFIKIFRDGERFPISLDRANFISVKIKEQSIYSGDLILKEIFKGEIINIIHSDYYIGIITKTSIEIYTLVAKGIVAFKCSINTNNTTNYILHKEKLFCVTNKLVEINLDTKQEKTYNIEIDNLLKYFIYKNVLFCVTSEKSYLINLDSVYNNYVEYTVNDIFGKSFKGGSEGLYQTINGNFYIFNEVNNKIDINKISKNIKYINQIESVGLVCYEVNLKIKNKLFSIDGLNKINYSDFEILTNKHVGFYNGLFAVSFDEKLSLIRKEDFRIVAEFKCDGITEENNTFFNKSGIFIQLENSLILANTK